jgi:hypothetical protein
MSGSRYEALCAARLDWLLVASVSLICCAAILLHCYLVLTTSDDLIHCSPVLSPLLTVHINCLHVVYINTTDAATAVLDARGGRSSHYTLPLLHW